MLVWLLGYAVDNVYKCLQEEQANWGRFKAHMAQVQLEAVTKHSQAQQAQRSRKKTNRFQPENKKRHLSKKKTKTRACSA